MVNLLCGAAASRVSGGGPIRQTVVIHRRGRLDSGANSAFGWAVLTRRISSALLYYRRTIPTPALVAFADPVRPEGTW
jgi:hypothetical protein